MKKYSFTLLATCFAIISISAQNAEVYRLYAADGQQVAFSAATEKLAEADLVLFGEQHNNPIDHWLQLELTKALHEKKAVVLGAEMFESDVQVVLNEYLSGKIKESHLENEAKIWPNYKTDYAPLVKYAKENQLPFIATNTPRRYASLVSRNGIEALSELSKEAHEFLPKLPYEVTPDDKGYALMRDMMGGGHGMGMNMDYLIAAQALKDYTMAHFIAENLPKDGLFLHFNGTFHSDYRSGIYGYLMDENNKLKVMTISSVEATESMDWDESWADLGDFILVKPSTMTKTH